MGRKYTNIHRPKSVSDRYPRAYTVGVRMDPDTMEPSYTVLETIPYWRHSTPDDKAHRMLYATAAIGNILYPYADTDEPRQEFVHHFIDMVIQGQGNLKLTRSMTKKTWKRLQYYGLGVRNNINTKTLPYLEIQSLLKLIYPMA